MLASIIKENDLTIAHFERHYNASIEEVWDMFTKNTKLKKWFPELEIMELGKGGRIHFNFEDGSFEELTIVDFIPYKLMEFTWSEDTVRFEFTSVFGGCMLTLHEKITEVTPHTPKDLTGWHVCLIVIEALLDERKLDDRMTYFNHYLPLYEEALQMNH